MCVYAEIPALTFQCDCSSAERSLQTVKALSGCNVFPALNWLLKFNVVTIFSFLFYFILPLYKRTMYTVHRLVDFKLNRLASYTLPFLPKCCLDSIFQQKHGLCLLLTRGCAHAAPRGPAHLRPLSPGTWDLTLMYIVLLLSSIMRGSAFVQYPLFKCEIRI